MDGLENLFIVTDQAEAASFPAGPVDKSFLESHIGDFGQHFYVCGPDKMVEDINRALKDAGR